MTSRAQEVAVRAQIVVAAPIERAFRVFTEEFDRIKPREHNLLSVEIAETVFEAGHTSLSRRSALSARTPRSNESDFQEPHS